MVTKFVTGVVLLVLFSVGCADQEREARRAKEEAEAKMRAEAARKEMAALPKAFKSAPFFKLNEPEKKSEPAPETKKANP
ncbi:MAG: hypothetical protein JNK23_12710 [Opitutaceae bacterium]|nr:hypothetical protein [Opitutaceae bacterium]